MVIWKTADLTCIIDTPVVGLYKDMEQFVQQIRGIDHTVHLQHTLKNTGQ